MAISEAFAGNETITTTEHSLVADSTSLATETSDGVFQAYIDLSALAAGDEVEFRLYEKVGAGSTKRVTMTARIAGLQGDPNWVTPALILMHGWDMTLKRINGTNRSIDWSIRKA